MQTVNELSRLRGSQPETFLTILTYKILACLKIYIIFSELRSFSIHQDCVYFNPILPAYICGFILSRDCPAVPNGHNYHKKYIKN